MIQRARKTVFVVEFDAEVREQCRLMLTGEGFDVVLGETTNDLWQLMEQQTPDLLIMSVYLAEGPSYGVFSDARLDSVPVVGLNDIFQGSSVRRLLKERYPYLELLDKPLAGANLIDLMRVHFSANYPQAQPSQGVDDANVTVSAWDDMAETTAIPVEEPGVARAAVAIEDDEGLAATTNHFRRVPTSPRHQAVSRAQLPEVLDWRAVPDKGDVSTTSFATLLSRMIHTRYTGSLRLWRERVRKIIYFDAGQVVAVRSNLLYECLGNVLVRSGFITEELNVDSVAQAQAEGSRQGEVLIGLGALTPEQLSEALRRQLQERLLDVFGWSQARYRTHAMASIPSVAVLSRGETQRLVMQGVLESMSSERIVSELEPLLSLHARLSNGRDALVELGLSEDHAEVVDALALGTTLFELVARLDQSAQVYPLVFGLIVLGHVIIDDAA